MGALRHIRGRVSFDLKEDITFKVTPVLHPQDEGAAVNPQRGALPGGHSCLLHLTAGILKMVMSSEQNCKAPEPLAVDEKCCQHTLGGDG